MKAVIVGSRALELDGDVAAHILHELIGLGERGFDEILLRKPLHRAARPFEALTASLAGVLGLTVTLCIPEPGGRAQVFLRDVSMVSASDEVVAFFPEDAEMSGGTGHVVEKALDQARPVRAYAVVKGELVLVGSDDDYTQARDSQPPTDSAERRRRNDGDVAEGVVSDVS